MCNTALPGGLLNDVARILSLRVIHAFLMGIAHAALRLLAKTI